jgi:hypothetical protein
MYLIDCYECRCKISDQARLCPKCGRWQVYQRAPIDHTPRHEDPRVVLGKSKWWD